MENEEIRELRRPFHVDSASVRFMWLHCLTIILIISAEYYLFKTYVRREIASAYPANYDQVSYLYQTYKTHEDIETTGFFKGFGNYLTGINANGIMIHLQSNLFFMIGGCSRVSALTLNFFYFALFQCVFTATLHWFSNRWDIAYLGFGLLLTIQTPFLGAGGMLDYRIDFIAFSLFGIFICLAVRSTLFHSWRWSVICGATAGFLVLFRFITLVYFIGVFSVLPCIIAFRFMNARRDSLTRSRLIHQLLGMFIAIAVMSCICVPILWMQRNTIWNYYVVNHVLGGEKAIRMKEFDIYSPMDVILFYPKSVWFDHAGSLFRRLSISLIITFCVFTLGRYLWPRPFLTDTVGINCLSCKMDSFLFLTVCLVAPYAILTVNSLKSPVVASILVPPLLWIILFLIVVSSKNHIAWKRSLTSSFVSVLAVGAILAGSYTQAQCLSRQGPFSRQRKDHEEVLRLYDAIGDYCCASGLNSPNIGSTSIADFMSPVAVAVQYYERKRVLLFPRVQLGNSIHALGESELLDRLSLCDIVMYNDADVPRTLPYPFEDSMCSLRRTMKAYCNNHFVKLDTFRFCNTDIVLYIRATKSANRPVVHDR